MYDKFIDKFMPSNDMREYLKTVEDLELWRLLDIIWHADTPVQDKLDALKELDKDPNIQPDEDSYYRQTPKSLIAQLEYALGILKTDGVYVLKIAYYDSETKNSEEDDSGLYSTFEEALEEANKAVESYKECYNDLSWGIITKWEKDENGKMVDRCEYHIVDSELKYINFENPKIEYESRYVEDMICMGDLYLPVPFSTGDIVEVNEAPFSPNFHGIIVDIGDNHDCCCVQGLARDRDGLWNIGAVKHNIFGIQTAPQKAMLYTIDRYYGELPEDEKVLKTVSEMLKNNKVDIDRYMFDTNWDFTDEELLEWTEKAVAESKK